jgi:hypothetical protein
MKEVHQCSSCGGFCKKSGCERENLPRYTVGQHRVDYADFEKALELACYYQNQCCDLEEIIELFCLDAERDALRKVAQLALDVLENEGVTYWTDVQDALRKELK